MMWRKYFFADNNHFKNILNVNFQLKVFLTGVVQPSLEVDYILKGKYI